MQLLVWQQLFIRKRDTNNAQNCSQNATRTAALAANLVVFGVRTRCAGGISASPLLSPSSTLLESLARTDRQRIGETNNDRHDATGVLKCYCEKECVSNGRFHASHAAARCKILAVRHSSNCMRRWCTRRRPIVHPHTEQNDETKHNKGRQKNVSVRSQRGIIAFIKRAEMTHFLGNYFFF